MACIGEQFLAASQVHKSPSTGGGAIYFWAWHKNQTIVKSYPVEPIEPLTCTRDGVYLAGGGVSGRIYLWEVTTGRLLKVWPGHYKSVKCLVFSDDDSLLISGADDGFVCVWPLLRVLAKDSFQGAGETQPTYLHKWAEHTLPITGLVSGCGGSSAIVVSCSLDHTCKIWSLALGTLLRSILFPAAINSIAMDPGEYALYAGGTDGRIFISALNFGVPTSSGLVAIDGLLGPDGIGHSRAVTSLMFSMDGVSLVSGSEDCTVRVWDTVSRHVIRTFTLSKGPISNLLVMPQPLAPQHGLNEGNSLKHRGPLLPVANLSKYVITDVASQDANPWEGPPIILPSSFATEEENMEAHSYSINAMDKHIRELEKRGSTVEMQMEVERLRSELRRALNNGQQWQQLHQELYCFCVDELMGCHREREDDEEKETDRERDKESERERIKGRNKLTEKAKER